MTRYRSHHEMCAGFAPFIMVLLHQWFIKFVLCRPNMKGYLQISDTGKFMGLIIYVSRLIVNISLVDVGFSCKRSVAVGFRQWTLSFFNVREVFSCRQLVSVILMFFFRQCFGLFILCVYKDVSFRWLYVNFIWRMSVSEWFMLDVLRRLSVSVGFACRVSVSVEFR